MSPNTIVRSGAASRDGWYQVHPAFANSFAALGIDSAAGFLGLPGEVVSGHPDRHVVRVVLPGMGHAAYLKRQHMESWREKLRNALAGFGWTSRSVREARVLQRLAADGLRCPRWMAFGEDDRGRAFLLVEEIAGAVDLRQYLGDREFTPRDRRDFAKELGGSISDYHAAGYTTPDLTAKHLLVSATNHEIIPIDWQSSRRAPRVRLKERIRALAMLHASVADHLATPRERLRVLREALGEARRSGEVSGRFSAIARRVNDLAGRFRERHSIRDQRQDRLGSAQRLVWVAGEAVCAIPDVAASWPRDAIGPPFYGCQPGTLRLRLPDGREGFLIRGRTVAPLARLLAAIRGRSWRSPGVILGRVLFHLERYGIAAPRLLAFGQRLTGPASAEWFALHTPPADELPRAIDRAMAEQLGCVLRRLHDAGCRIPGEPLTAFGWKSDAVAIRAITRVILTRRIVNPEREADLARLLADLPTEWRTAAETAYRIGTPAPARARHNQRPVPQEMMV